MKQTFHYAWILICIIAGIFCYYFIWLLLSYPGAFLYFPGDPPYVDLAAPMIMVLTLGTGLLSIVEKIWIKSKEPMRLRFVTKIMVLGCFLLTIFTYGIRLSPIWEEIRNKPINAPEIMGKVYDWESQPSSDIIRYWARMPGYGRVLVEKSRRNPEGVHVDFGNGSNAWFSLRTMYCNNSD